MRRRPWRIGLLGAVALAAAGCGDDGGGYATGTAGPGATAGAGTTTAGDSGGSPTTTAGGTGEPPPEIEDEGDFRVPKASGKFVYSASETTDSVAVIDTATLAIEVVGVGQGPTVVQPIPGQGGQGGAVVVLDQRSDDVALLRTDEGGATTVAIHPVTPGANNLAVSPGGQFVFVYHDVDGPEQLGPGSDQELTVLDTATGTTYAMTVGAHPREVVFSTDDSTAWVITAAGVNVIPFASLGTVGKPPILPVVADPGIDPATLEVQVVASEGVALARVDGEPWLAMTDLADGLLTVVDLPAIPTDLDVAPAGGFAVLTLPDLGGQSSFLELPIALGGKYTQHMVPGEYVGQSAIAPSGDAMLLFTTVDPFAGKRPPPPALPLTEDAYSFGSSSGSSSGGESTGSSGGESTGGTTGEASTGGSTGEPPPPPPDFDPRQRITLARRAGPAWELVTLFVDVPVTSVGVAPNSASALLVHARDDGNANAPWSYSLFDLTPKFPLLKRQTTQAEPGPVLFTPDGGRAAVLLRDDASAIKKVDLVDLGNFIVEPLLLGSPPEGAGYVDATQKIFVSQEHPTGRITFVGPNGEVQTVTGYVLNDTVKD